MVLTGCFITGTFMCSVTGGTGLPELVIPDGFGVNIHFTGEPRDLDLIAEAGFRFIRMDLVWGGVEREKGIYNFGGYDALTEGCIKRGIRILYILDYSNRLYESNRSVRAEEGRQAFAAFAEEAARRYSGKGILWEIWNEPNLNQFWSPQPGFEDYCALVEATAPRIREADPSGLVLAPATSGIPFDWLEECFKRGLLKQIDALTVHPYRPHPPENVLKRDYAQLRELIQRYIPKDKNMPVISGEWGYSLINWDRSRLSEEQQAEHLARMFLVNLYQGFPISIWYDWKDDGTDPNEREHHFGTMTHDLKPKPAYRAVKALANALEGYSVVQRLDLGNEQDFALKLKNDRGNALAFWTMIPEHRVTLPVEAGKGTLISLYGDEKPVSWHNAGLEVTISQSPAYLIIKGEM